MAAEPLCRKSPEWCETESNVIMTSSVEPDHHSPSLFIRNLAATTRPGPTSVTLAARLPPEVSLTPPEAARHSFKPQFSLSILPVSLFYLHLPAAGCINPSLIFGSSALTRCIFLSSFRAALYNSRLSV